MKYYENLVIFNEPLQIPTIGNNLVYGIGITYTNLEQEALLVKIQGYVEYLCAVQRWASEGGTIDDSNWIDKEGNIRKLSYSDEFFVNYIGESYEANPIDYMVLMGCKTSFLNNEVDNDFIIKNIKIWKR